MKTDDPPTVRYEPPVVTRLGSLRDLLAPKCAPRAEPADRDAPPPVERPPRRGAR